MLDGEYFLAVRGGLCQLFELGHDDLPRTIQILVQIPILRNVLFFKWHEDLVELALLLSRILLNVFEFQVKRLNDLIFDGLFTLLLAQLFNLLDQILKLFEVIFFIALLRLIIESILSM